MVGAAVNIFDDDGDATVAHSFPPEFISGAATPDLIPVNSPVTLSASFRGYHFNDGMSIDTIEFIIFGTTDWLPMDLDNDDLIVTGTATFTPEAPGVYPVAVRSFDIFGNGMDRFIGFLVAYDPSGGFVTGGGWFWSPEGAYYPDPSLEGKATFGFVSKYKKGANVPTGQTEFQFNVGDLNFHSTSYDWLVVAGKKAMFKGIGTINGEGEYKFMVSAIDGDLKGGDGFDKFRIRIWQEENDEEIVIYDNQLNDFLDADPTTILGAGSIVIHTAK
jgi:hypothetical protein